MYYRHSLRTRARGRSAVAEYIEFVYDRLRLHSTLSYRTPSKPAPAISEQQPLPDQQPEEQYKILDTPQ